VKILSAIGCLGLFLFAAQSALSNVNNLDEDSVRTATLDILERTETFANALDFAFDYAVTFRATSGAPAPVFQAELESIVSRLNGVRSMLVIDSDGALQFDAFSFPAPDINLASRPYFATAIENRGMHFEAPVLGQTSGFPFVPASSYKAVIDAVLVAVIDTRVLQKPLSWCLEKCGGAIITPDGQVVAISPDDTQLPAEIIEAAKSERSGSLLVERGTFSLMTHWQKSEKRSFTAIAFVMIPNGNDAPPATD
jgi:hypothetical protein